MASTKRLATELVLIAVPDPTLPPDRKRAFAQWCEEAIFDQIKRSQPDLYAEVLSGLKAYMKGLLDASQAIDFWWSEA